MRVLYFGYNQFYINMDNEVIKKKFYELRRKKGLSWVDLAAKAGVSDYHKIMNLFNTGGLTLATLERLSALVDCEPWELIQPDPDPEITTNGDDLQNEQPAKIICPHCGKELYLIPAAKPDDK